MRLIRSTDTAEILAKFGYRDTNDAWAQLRCSKSNLIQFTVPSFSLKQAALCQTAVGSLFAEISEKRSREVVIWLEDWSIYYEYELRLFWKNLDCELRDGESPPYYAAYWTELNASCIDKIRAALFMMMAFEFSGCILGGNRLDAVCIDDGTMTVFGGDPGLRKVIGDMAV